MEEINLASIPIFTMGILFRKSHSNSSKDTPKNDDESMILFFEVGQQPSNAKHYEGISSELISKKTSSKERKALFHQKKYIHTSVFEIVRRQKFWKM